MRKLCLALLSILVACTCSFALENDDSIQQIQNFLYQDILDQLVDGAAVEDWMRIALPEIGYLEEQANQIRQARMRSSLDKEAQPQNKTTLTKQKERTLKNNLLAKSIGAFCLGISNMANDTVVGGLGWALGNIGAGIEKISPFSGTDTEALDTLMRAGVSDEVINSLPLYRDSWFTSLGKDFLKIHKNFTKQINQWRIQWIEEATSDITKTTEFIGSLSLLFFYFYLVWKVTPKFISWVKKIKPYKILSISNNTKDTIDFEVPSSPHSEPHEAPNPHQQDAVRLVGLGLAAIGRRTAQPNPYLTPEREAQRHNAERPFLLKLAAKHKDASARKVLAKHFVLYKEACLYIIFASLLKDNPELHGLVKQELTKQLSEGLSAKALIRRKEYMFAFSRAFYDEYQRTRNVERVLSFMFCQVLRDKHPELESEELSGLGQVYRYVYETVKGH